MLALAVKLIGAPLLVGGASFAGRCYGPGLAGLLSGLPVIAGPILLVLWLEHGTDYAVQAARMLLVGQMPLAAYLWLFSRLARRRRWPFCLLAGWSIFMLVAQACYGLAWSYWLLAGSAVLVLLGVGLSLPKAEGAAASNALPAVELLARVLAAFALVFALTTVSPALGAKWTGLLAAFPVAGSVMPAFTLARSGPPATLRLLRGFVSGLLGLGGFALGLILLLPVLGALAFLIAILAAVGIAWFNSVVVFRS